MKLMKVVQTLTIITAFICFISSGLTSQREITKEHKEKAKSYLTYARLAYSDKEGLESSNLF